MSLLRSEKCPDSVNQDLSACVLNTGMILALAGNSDLFVQLIAHISAAAVPSSVLQYLKKRDRSHNLPNPQEATDHSL